MFEIFQKYLTDKIELSDEELQLIASVCKQKKNSAKNSFFVRKEIFGIIMLLSAEVW
jgi:hypothetical protein